MEALQQRLAKYKEGEDQAKQEGVTSKMKRMGRIVKVLLMLSAAYVIGKRVVSSHECREPVVKLNSDS